MRATRTVCLLCRHTRTGGATQPRQNLKRLLSNQVPVRSDAAEGPTRDGRDAACDYGSEPEPTRPLIRRLHYTEKPQSRGGSRPQSQGASRHTWPRLVCRIDENLDHILDNITTHDRLDGRQDTRDRELMEHIGKVQELLGDGSAEGAMRAYKYLRTEVYPALRQEGRAVPQHFFTVVTRLMLVLIRRKGRDMASLSLPPSNELLRVCADMGNMKSAQVEYLIAHLLEVLCDPKVDREQRDVWMADLVECWKVLSLPKTMVLDPPLGSSRIFDGFCFPQMDEVAMRGLAGTRGFHQALSRLFPNHANALSEGSVVLAMLTYALLLEPGYAPPSVMDSTGQFREKMAFIIRQVDVTKEELRALVMRTLPRIRAELSKRWPHVRGWVTQQGSTIDMAARSRSETGARSNGETAARPGSDAAERWAGDVPRFSPGAIYNRVKSAFLVRSVAQVDLAWHDFLGGQGLSRERAVEMLDELIIFCSFLSTYMALNYPDKALAVWKVLEEDGAQYGLKPDIRHWNAMLDGCKKAKNAAGLKAIWNSLTVTARIPLDIQIWTTRVAGLIECNLVAEAFDALEDLVKRWSMAEVKHDVAAVKPSAEPVNAMLRGLLQLGKRDEANRLLAWAGRCGIQPDVVTFNILLRPLIRQNRRAEVDALFRAMDKTGVKANEATWTILLDGTLANMPDASAQAQKKVVQDILAQMTLEGLEPNLETYGKMIYYLLHNSDGGMDAINAVLDHMFATGHDMSIQMYTMLIQGCFEHEPPNLAAVDRLLEHRNLADRTSMDRAFYERLIKGYAGAGRVGTAMDMYRKLANTGALPDLPTQEQLLAVLIQEQRWDDAEFLVNRTMQRFREMHSEDHSEPQHDRFWNHGFWHMAFRNGLLPALPKTSSTS